MRCYLITDCADYLIVGYGKDWIYHDSAEHLVMYVSVEMFHQPSIGKSRYKKKLISNHSYLVYTIDVSVILSEARRA